MLYTLDSVELLGDVDGQADRSALGGDRPSDPLANPPVGVGAETKAAGGIEFFDRPFESQSALLHQIQQFHASVLVLLRDGHHQAQIGLDHPVTSFSPFTETPLQVAALGVNQTRPGFIPLANGLVQFLQRHLGGPCPFLSCGPVREMVGLSQLQFLKAQQPFDCRVIFGQLTFFALQALVLLHEARQHHLVFRGEQVHPTDVLQVETQQVVAAAPADRG